MKRLLRFCAASGVALALASCNPLLGSLPSGMVDSTLVQHVPYAGSFSYTVDPGSTPRDVYFVFTNPSMNQNAASVPSVSGSVVVDGRSLPAPALQRLSAYNSAPQTLMERIAEFNRSASVYTPSGGLPGPSSSTMAGNSADQDVAGTTAATVNLDAVSMAAAAAHCRATVGPVTFADGRTRTLSIWVDDSAWNTEVTAANLSDIASRFLATSGSSDIYHWDTSIVGEPWGPQPFSNLIQWDSKNTITIFLGHLNTSYVGSVIVGFFYARDNFTTSTYPGSNQRIMFYLDSTLYHTVVSGDGAAGDPANHWPKIVFSTLAHEFQHMIQFYQKQVLYNTSSGTDTWINEMCSMLMEDLVADKLQVEGPRGVAYTDGSAGTAGNTLGRIPSFNQYSNAALGVTSGYDVFDYSTTYAFGAWLIRNYGGPDLVRRIVQSADTGPSAVEKAAGAYSHRTETMQRLLERWAASVLLSDQTNAPAGYRYNTGSWLTFPYGGQTFDLGSINVFNYFPTLTIYNGSSSVPVPPYYSSNTYYLAANGLSGSHTFSVTLPAGVEMSVVLK